VRVLVRAGGSTADAPMLTRLCEVAVDELRMSGAVVSLMTPVGTERDQSGNIAAASSDRARAIDELEFSLGEGPGRDAFLTSRPVLTSDLDRAFDRWPGYVPAALDAGVLATFAFPLLVGAARFGVLHFHSPEVRTLTNREIATSLVLTELAMEIVLDAFAPVGVPTPSDIPLLGAADRRDEIYQAQGMVMVALGISLHEALARMRALAFASDLELADLAVDILSGRTRLQHDPDVAG
jgi:GAF domain/ANTAR domain